MTCAARGSAQGCRCGKPIADPPTEGLCSQSDSRQMAEGALPRDENFWGISCPICSHVGRKRRADASGPQGETDQHTEYIIFRCKPVLQSCFRPSDLLLPSEYQKKTKRRALVGRDGVRLDDLGKLLPHLCFGVPISITPLPAVERPSSIETVESPHPESDRRTASHRTSIDVPSSNSIPEPSLIITKSVCFEWGMSLVADTHPTD